MPPPSRRVIVDRRSMPRGGRRATDRPGRFPVLLVADSYSTVRRTYARYLTRFGFDVGEATNGAEAAALLDRVRPRVIVTESTLPDMSLLVDRLSADDRLVDTRVIALATWDAAPVPARTASVLLKPFRLRVMLDEIRAMLRAPAVDPVVLRRSSDGVLGRAYVEEASTKAPFK